MLEPVKRTKIKRVIAEVTDDVFNEIKVESARRGITMRKFILQSIIEKIQRDKEYDAE